MDNIKFMVITSQYKTILLPKPERGLSGEISPKFYIEKEPGPGLNVMVSTLTTDPVVLKECSTETESIEFLEKIVNNYMKTYDLSDQELDLQYNHDLTPEFFEVEYYELEEKHLDLEEKYYDLKMIHEDMEPEYRILEENFDSLKKAHSKSITKIDLLKTKNKDLEMKVKDLEMKNKFLEKEYKFLEQVRDWDRKYMTALEEQYPDIYKSLTSQEIEL